jgi:tetratricopeptide (TPR) repeat protein
VGLLVVLALAGAALVLRLQAPGPAAPPDARRDPAGHAQVARAAEIRQRFDAAVLMLHARQYEHAVTALHRVLALDPRLTEAHVNMGYALVGLGRPAAARDFFEAALALNPEQANAYYGLALAWEAQGDLPMATGAMRSYLHRAQHESEAHLRRARAALWTWQQRRDAAGGTSAPGAAGPPTRPAR